MLTSLITILVMILNILFSNWSKSKMKISAKPSCQVSSVAGSRAKVLATDEGER